MKNRFILRLLSILLGTILFFPATAAFSPDAISVDLASRNNKVVKLLQALKQNNQLSAESSLSVIQKELSPIIDFYQLAQQATGKYWRRANDEEKQHITQSFRQLLENTYAKVLARYSDQEVNVIKAKTLPKDKISVEIEVVGGSKKASIEYIYHEREGDAKIIDIKVEGISLLSTYRRQFGQIIKSDGISGLITRLQKISQ